MSNSKTVLNRREFISIAGTGAAGILVSASLPCAAAPNSGVPKNRLDRLAKGANVCRWFRFMRREQEDHFKNYLTEPEANSMRQMGLTHVRLCLQPRVVMDQSTGAVRPETAEHVETAIERFTALVCWWWWISITKIVPRN
jgi:hypothetical protein